jgi:hypothetical protein
MSPMTFSSLEMIGRNVRDCIADDFLGTTVYGHILVAADVELPGVTHNFDVAAFEGLFDALSFTTFFDAALFATFLTAVGLRLFTSNTLLYR